MPGPNWANWWTPVHTRGCGWMAPHSAPHSDQTSKRCGTVKASRFLGWLKYFFLLGFWGNSGILGDGTDSKIMYGPDWANWWTPVHTRGCGWMAPNSDSGPEFGGPEFGTRRNLVTFPEKQGPTRKETFFFWGRTASFTLICTMQRILARRMDWCLLMCGLMIGSVNAQVDVTPPVLVSLDFNPKVVDTTSAPATVTLTARITDDLSGVSQFSRCFMFKSPSQTKNAIQCWDRISGTALDGIYQRAIGIPAFTEPGTWTLDLYLLADTAGNDGSKTAAALQAAGFPATLSVTSASDLQPPTVMSLDFTPKVVDTTSAPATVTLTARITDDLSGLSTVNCFMFKSPSQAKNAIQCWDRISGTALDGIYQRAIQIPAFTEPGTWTLDLYLLSDAVGNSGSKTAAALLAAGFPATLSVTSAPDLQPPTVMSLDFTPKVVDTTSAPATVTLTARITDDLSGVSQFRCFMFKIGRAHV